MIRAPRHRRGQAGFSLIEMLIAAVVIVIGLLGVGMLLLTSVRKAQEASVDTQADLMAQSMIDRMSANTQAVWTGAYDGDYDSEGATPGNATCGPVNPCDAEQLALRDRIEWTVALSQFLPGSKAQIECTPVTPVPVGAQVVSPPPFAGHCEIQIDWLTAGSVAATPDTRQIAWRFTP